MPEVHRSAATAATDDEAADTEPQEDDGDTAAAGTAASLISADVQRPPATPVARAAGTADAAGSYAAQQTPAGSSDVPPPAATPVAHVGSASASALRGVAQRMSTAAADVSSTPEAEMAATASGAAAAAGPVAVQLDMPDAGEANVAPGVTPVSAVAAADDDSDATRDSGEAPGGVDPPCSASVSQHSRDRRIDPDGASYVACVVYDLM